MAARTTSKVTPKYKTKYRVTNWAAYERSLRNRGDIPIWFDEIAIAAWNATPTGKPGGQLRYSDLAIITSELTDSSVDDASVGISMIEKVEAAIGRFTADGAYDTRGTYESLAASGAADIKVVVPPKKTAVVDPRASGPWRQRNDAIERIAEVGRRQCRKESGAHQQARAENGMYRYKRIIGDGLRARTFEAQAREAMIAVNVLNRMTELGMPESVKIAA